MEEPKPAVREGILRRGFILIRTHWRAWLVANAAYFAVLIVGLIVATFNREIQEMMMDAIGQAFGEGGPLSAVTEAYTTGQALRAIVLTFVVNLIVGTFASITLPSLVVPFSGWLVALYRALLWGFIFAPSLNEALSLRGIFYGLLVAILILLEGEAYVLGMLAAWLQGREFVFYRRQGHAGPGRGYVAGLKQTALMYIPIVVVLIVAAIYEVIIALVLT